MTFMLTRIKVDDFDAWKAMFDQGRETVRREAKGHRILRSAEEPNELFVQVEFESAEAAAAARQELLSSGALDRVTVKVPPTITEEVETVAY